MTKKTYLFITLSFLLIALTSCNTTKENINTYFGGKIINPKTKFVFLYHEEKVIDTLLLNDKNQFLGTYDNLIEGLYYFVHGNENQSLYLEPTDSLMLRLNTWNFDESIVFAGKGAERNNILIDIFLENESENRFSYQLNKLKPTEYKNTVDSIINSKLETYTEYVDLHPNETEKYFKILKTALTHPIYSRAERYAVNHSHFFNKDSFVEIDSSFYSYREQIDYKDNSLMYYAPYARYITNYLYNLTYEKGHQPMKNEISSDFTIDLLNIINKKISSQDSKNAFLRRTVLEHFYKKSSCDVNEETFDVFFKLTTNKKDQIQIKKLIKDSKVIRKGDEIKGFSILDFTNQPIDIEDITINKNSVLLFWSKDYVSKAFVSSRIVLLQKKYPSLYFATIEIDGNNTNKINHIDIKNQFFINSKTLKNNFLSSKMNRTILINKNGIVENGYAAISSSNINKQLEKLSEIK